MLRIVSTENGKVRGLPAADPRITAFKGIPFAAPKHRAPARIGRGFGIALRSLLYPFKRRREQARKIYIPGNGI